MAMAVQVVPYDPQWPEIFQREAERIKQALGDNCVEVLHIGSTSITGLAAKPIIDMIPVVKDIQSVNEIALEKLGYTCKGEYGMLFRNFCVRYEPKCGFHAHIWEKDNAEIDKHLVFRRYLLDHPDDLKAYETLKLDLAKKYSDDNLTYSLSKDDLVKEILSKAGFKGKTIVQALTKNEWTAYHRIRKEQIFDRVGIVYDPNHLTLKAPNHRHFVMSLGPNVVGAAHLEFLDGTRVALRPFAMDSDYQNQGLGAWFLTQLERWLRHQNKSTLILHADSRAVPFYRRLGYTEMPFTGDEPLDSDSVDMGKHLNSSY